MIYEKSRELAQLSFEKWLSTDLFSFNWFVMIGVLVVFYIVWLKLLDKSRAGELLLIGSLAAVAFTISAFVIIEFLGLTDYLTKIFPLNPPIFITSETISPIIIMLVQQYTTSWKGYMLWTAVGFAFLSLVIFPIYTAIGILELHKNWNWFYHYIVLFTAAQIVRLVFLWITGTERRNVARKN